MPSLEEQVVAALEVADRPLDDDALAVLLGVRRQAINQLCRRLATTGRIDRQPAQGGKIVNRLVGGVAVEAGEFPPASGPAEKEPLLFGRRTEGGGT